MFELFGAIKPSVIIGAFDAIHGSLALAVAKKMNIPWFALQFSVIPAGLASFCDKMYPAARVLLSPRPFDELHALASVSLRDFENRRIQAPAYIAPAPLPLAGKVANLPNRLSALQRKLRRSRSRKFLQFTSGRHNYSVSAAIEYFRHAARSRKALSRPETWRALLPLPLCCLACICSRKFPLTFGHLSSAIKCGLLNARAVDSTDAQANGEGP